MVYYFVKSKLEEKKEKLGVLADAIQIHLKEINENLKCLEDLNKTYESLMAEVRSIEFKLNKIKAENEKMNLVLADLNAEKDEIEKMIKNVIIIEVINVDEEWNGELMNGLVGLNRDILMKLFKISRNEKKIRNVRMFLFI
jgi:chromosome segregation ATPase